MSESSSTWVPFKRYLDIANWKYDRIENNIGIADLVIYVPNQHQDVWIEMKYVQKADENVNLGLRKEQFIWMRNSYLAGRSVLLLARVGNWWYLWNDVDSWEMAKSKQNWEILMSRCTWISNHIEELVGVLANRNFTRPIK